MADRLRVDLAEVRRTGDGLQGLADGLQEVLSRATASLRETQTLSGHDGMDAALDGLAQQLAWAAREPVAALAELGKQLHHAAAAYREADVALAAAAPRVVS